MVEKQGLCLDLKDSEVVRKYLKEIESQNIAFKENVVKLKFNLGLENPLLAFHTINKNNVRIGQDVLELGTNLQNIFNIPFEYGTWYADTWNIKAKVYYNGMEYFYTFRELKEGSNKNMIIESIRLGRRVLTPTYMGHESKTVLMSKRRK